MSVSNFAIVRQLDILTVLANKPRWRSFWRFSFVTSKQKMAHGM